MEQLDWVGDQKRKPFKDVRNTRESTAEEKARLCLELGVLLKSIPERLKGGGTVNVVREWKRDHAAAEKVAGNKRSTVEELKYQIRVMGKWHQ